MKTKWSLALLIYFAAYFLFSESDLIFFSTEAIYFISAIGIHYLFQTIMNVDFMKAYNES